MADLTPREIVRELDRYIVGQDAAKKAVAVAIRNRWRRQQLPPELRKDVTPKNIIMIGPTGVGKTEIARRLAQLVGAPFLKVEATKYTEVGYHGRDVESMIRDLAEIAIGLVKQEQRRLVETQARERVKDRLLDLLVPASTGWEADNAEENERNQRTQRKISIKEARRVLLEQESEALIDRQVVTEKAIELTENQSIIFVDELDKICGPPSTHGPDVSRQGVQRDLLPVVEGTTVNTRYGPVRTDHILFIAAGAFHLSKPSDLMPELQGRFPIRVELTDLKRDDFLRILTEPKHSLTKQYAELLATEGVTLEFSRDGIEALADIAYEVNRTMQNIGARRLHTILERVVEEVSFEGPELPDRRVVIDGVYVRGRLTEILEKEDLSKFIL